MRTRLVVVGLVVGLAVMLVASAGAAQDGLRSASLPDRTPAQPIPPPRVDQFIASPFTYAPRLDPRRRHHRRDYVPFGYGYAPELLAAPDRRRADEMVPTGYLDFRLQPGTAEVHVDGLYMGSVDDFRRVIPGRPIEAGPHRVELRAPGFETATFDVRVFPNETTTYRTDLRPDRPGEQTLRAVPGRPKTFYVIPGCYAGDKPPRAARLRPGCDASRVRRIPPAPASVVDRRG